MLTVKPCPLAAADFVELTGAGIEGRLVHRHVEHLRIALEDVLRAIAVVNVVVDDRDPIDAERTGMRRADRDVVVEAEAHGAIAFGMVAGRANQREGPGVPAVDHPLDTLHRSARGQQRHLVGLGAGEGVGIERDRRPRRLGDPLQVVAVVHAVELLARGGARRHDFASRAAPGVGHDVHDLGPFGTLGMTGRVLVLRELRPC